ncbi:hypothetical protein [Streptomyces sp. RTGN2]|uniref:hypothetical protein n=1 Tax=Streptomyces sp. RTGN2 TaxID=3016525 RepID=UPI00255784E8|nr:hypothetical protein [Streptomyces sp. RTGN2]
MAQPQTVEPSAAIVPPAPSAVLSYAAAQSMKAAQALWPAADVRLGEVAPSVTSYVQQVEIDGRSLFAKCSILGVSLVSVLRGTCGDWETVKAAQAAYSSSPKALLRRETAQLRALAAAGVRVPWVAGYQDGVLFTEAVDGPNLADLVLREPHRTAELLLGTVDELETGLGRPGTAACADRAPIGERSISATFQRKFNGLSGATYLHHTGHGEVLTAVVSRLRQARMQPVVADLPVIFGDLKPEHVVFDGQGRAVFLDPGLQRGRPCADTAKLLSRTVLNLVSRPTSKAGTHAVLSGVSSFIIALCTRLAVEEQEAWLRQLVLLWLMDSTNILTTYLSAPAGLPLSADAAAVVGRVAAVVGMLDHASQRVTSRAPADVWWRMCLDDALQAVAA